MIPIKSSLAVRCIYTIRTLLSVLPAGMILYFAAIAGMFSSCAPPVPPVETVVASEKLIDSVPGDCPYITQNQLGQPVISWVRMDADSTAILCYSVSTDSGRSFEKVIPIPPSADINPHSENLPKIIFKPSGEIIAMWGEKNPTPENKYTGLIRYAQSFDNGENWTEARPLVNDPAGYDQRYADLTILQNGEAAIVWLDNRKTVAEEGSALYFAETSGRDGFGEERLISQPTCQCCRTSLYADREGNIHALYRGILPGSIRDMMHTVSTDGGKHFSTPKRIYPDNWELDGCPHTGPGMTETQSGVHFTWYTGARDRGTFYAGSTDKGETVTGHRKITGNGTHPQLAAISDSTVAIVWDEPFRNGDQFGKRIGLQVISDSGITTPQLFLTDSSGRASYPVITALTGNKAVIAYCKEKENKKYIAYQRRSLPVP